jgi:hypothetical protein
MNDFLRIIDALLKKYEAVPGGPRTLEDALYSDAPVFIAAFPEGPGFDVYTGAPGLMERFRVERR